MDRAPWALLCKCSFPDVMMPAYSRNPWSCVFFIVYLSIELYFIMNLVSDCVWSPLGAAGTVLGAMGMEKEAPHRQGPEVPDCSQVWCGDQRGSLPGLFPSLLLIVLMVEPRLPRDLFILTADV